MTAKTLLICLDGTEPDMLKEWSGSGELPNFQKLFSDWFSYPITTHEGMGDSVFWSSVITGVAPGTHGHYFPMQYNDQSYTLYRFNQDEHLGAEPFFQFCNKIGARVGLVDVYAAPFRQGSRGVQVQDWLMHDPILAPRSWPASLLSVLQEKYLVDKFEGTTEQVSRSDAEFIEFHKLLLERVEAKTRACSDLLMENEWDMFCMGYAELHDLGHQSWHWHDPSCESHPAELVEKLGNPFLQTLKHVDASLPRILEAAKATNVYLVVGLGMAKQCAFNSVVQPILSHFCGIQGTRRELTDMRFQMPYFEVPHNMNSAMIRINLKGRESKGLIDEDKYEETCDYLTERLWSIKDSESGEPVVKRIVRLQQAHPGELAHQLPDLCVEWKKPMSSSAVVIDDGSRFVVQADFMPEMRQGDHNDHALFVSNQGYDCADMITPESIAPTLCRTLGVNLPYSDSSPLRLLSA